jgi:hypothetical protein
MAEKLPVAGPNFIANERTEQSMVQLRRAGACSA